MIYPLEEGGMVVDSTQNTNALISLVGNVSANDTPFLVRDIKLSAFHIVPM